MTTDNPLHSDPYLQRLKAGLNSSAVLKAELGAVKSSCDKIKIFAYEGVDDKTLYSHWLLKTGPDIEYEPFVCRNKNQLLQLWSSLKNDLTGMGENVYFFTDRDFDDLRSHEADESIFMTEKYSIENYLVDSDILEEILKIEFHCHGNADLRKNIISVFEETYQDYLNLTTDLNFRIYLARKCRIRQLDDLAVSLNDIAEIRLDSVQKVEKDIGALVSLEREPSGDEVSQHRPAFASLNSKDRYRGKFAILFFRKWLNLLLRDRNSERSTMFHGLPQGEFRVKGDFSFEFLAGRVKPPDSFRKFIANIQPRIDEPMAAAVAVQADVGEAAIASHIGPGGE